MTHSLVAFAAFFVFGLSSAHADRKNQAEQSIYEVTGEILEGMARKKSDTPAGIQKAQADSRSGLTPVQRTKIEELSRELASDPTRSSNPH